MMIGSSFSSETRTAHLPEARSELIMMSFERMSSFFWSSPWTLAVPATPILHRPKAAVKHVVQLAARLGWCLLELEGVTYRLSKLALRTLVAINLQVVWMAVKRRVKSPVAIGCRCC
jgi:hypothetical protein